MSKHCWPLALAVCFCSLAPSRAQDAPLAVAPHAGILLLRNGQVLSGNITEAGDHFYVALASGEIRLQADQVEFSCRTLPEGYERKKSRIDPDSVQDHLELATWCIRQKLFEQTAQELAAARAIDPRHPKVQLVERQLKLAQEQPAHVDRRPMPSDPAPSNDDLDRLLRGMPPGTVETFANTIQPLLLNTCGNAACHGAQSEVKMRLARTQLGKTASRRFTQRNLHAVLEMIDRADPRTSPLLTVPVGPHGTAKAAIFTNKEVAQYRQLVQWVMRVSQTPLPAQPASVERPDDHLLQRLPPRGKAQIKPGVPNQLPVGAEDEPLPAAPAARSLGKASEKKPPLNRSAADPSSGDPFDPEIFNRRFFPPQ